MIERIGPSKLIAIQAGKFDYAEAALDEPLHLVGPNNVGKTSLIAMLQFLYVDQQKHMVFARSLEETRRYYFPHPNSWILFECLTPTGFRVLGVRGLGPVKQHKFERFSYQGRFDPADYFNEERLVRRHEEIYQRLAASGFRLLEPKHLRAALTGVGDSKEVHLGLVPLKQHGHYARFKTIFRHLLRLSHLRQHELKELLLELFQTEFRQREIDLEKGYADQLRRIRKDRKAVLDLKTLAPDISELLESYDLRTQLRRRLPEMWFTVGRCFKETRGTLEARAAEYETALLSCSNKETELQTRETELTSRLRHATEERAVLDAQLDQVDKGTQEFRGFVREFEEQRLHDIENLISDLDVQLHSARQEPVEQLEKRLANYRSEIAERKGLLDNLGSAAASRIVDMIPRNDARLQLFRLLNPALLELPLGKEGVNILDEKTSRNGLAALNDSVRAGRLSWSGLELTLKNVREPDLQRYLDPNVLKEAIAELKRLIDRDESSLKAAAARKELEKKRDQLRGESKELNRHLVRWEEHQRDLQKSDSWKSERDMLATREDERTAQIQQLSRQRETLVLERRDLDDKRSNCKSEIDRLDKKIEQLTPPSPEWREEHDEAAGKVESDIDDIIVAYQRASEKELRLNGKVVEILQRIDSLSYGYYSTQDIPETFESLAQHLDALPQREKAVQELWTSLAVGLRSAFKALGQDLDRLRSEIDNLNRQLGKVQVSNLSRLRLLVEGKPEWLKRISKMIATEEMPLFADFAQSEEAVEEVGHLLEKHAHVSLGDLFDLSFEITTADGEGRKYENLDAIESNGTTITIKVLVNLLLLRQLLGKDNVRIPFYLDEASSLDEANLIAIVDHAKAQGFIPVLASPDPMDAAEYLYFMSEQGNGRVVLEPETSLFTIKRRVDEQKAVSS